MSMTKKIFNNKLYVACMEDEIFDLTAKTAYKLFFSFFPFMIFLFSFLSHFHIRILYFVMPPFVVDILIELANAKKTIAVDILSFIVFLYAFIKVFLEIKKNVVDILDGDRIKKSAKYIIPTLLIIASILFNVFVQYFFSLPEFYGKVGLIMGVAMWQYAMVFSIYFGLELSQVIPENLPNPVFNVPDDPLEDD